MRSTLASTAELIGWHRHGRSWVWGICPRDGCDLCDSVDAWLETQVDWRDEVAAELRTRAAVKDAEMVRFGSDPHTPQPVSAEDAPSMDKIRRQSKRKTVIKEEPETTLFDATRTVVSTMVPDNETDDIPSPPPPPAPSAFQLTNPTEHTITKTGKRKRR